ncbi:nitrous oxide reductase family maturation protein NosD [Chromatiaceae bacterium AAb-1]|nr:nitrous oxide reductase family maturation protein NosD [Chromatiaceae bacterium AAb-1]
MQSVTQQYFRLVLLGILSCCRPAASAELSAITTLPLQQTADGHYHLAAGVYTGSFVIEQSMKLVCEPGAILDAAGSGHGIIIQASQVRLQGCRIRNWGNNLTTMDSGIFIEPRASNTEIIANHLQGPGFGIFVERAQDILLRDNHITGDPGVRSQDRGNGIHLFAVSGANIISNQISHTRDGIYIDTSHHNMLAGNTLEDLRYGIHYMFANNNTVINNTTRRTRTGYALMQSRQLIITGNVSEQDQNYGILMNYITYSTINNNRVSNVRSGSTGDSMISGAEGKALFIYNSVFNHIEGNVFETSALGIHLTAGSENNAITGNSFLANRQQVKYVATRTQEWSEQGRGNFWSDYLGWDRDNDGTGDTVYEPNDNIDRLLWLYPQVRLLLNSPAIELLRWVQRAFPVMKSPGVKDSHPLMRRPVPEKRNYHESSG